MERFKIIATTITIIIEDAPRLDLFHSHKEIKQAVRSVGNELRLPVILWRGL